MRKAMADSPAGHRDIRLPYAYLGADDQAGPGYAGQPASARTTPRPRPPSKDRAQGTADLCGLAL